MSALTRQLRKNYLCSILLLIVVLIGGCGTGGNQTESPPPEYSSLPLGDYELLFIGNSHSSINGLPNLVTILIEAGEEGKVANAGLAPGWNFLDERLNDGVTYQTIKAREWTHIFLQAQKYSSTGLYSYPTDAAKEWIKTIKTQNALPIMFPEWPRRGNREEGQRVYELHLSIAADEPACVAPVGPVWDEFISRYPSITLHASDGNHSNLNGALLTAYIFYQVITGNSANGLDYIPEINVSEDIQEKFREVVSIFHEVHLPCPL